MQQKKKMFRYTSFLTFFKKSTLAHNVLISQYLKDFTVVQYIHTLFFLQTFRSLPHHAFVQFQLNVYWQASSFFFFFLLFSLFNLVNFILLSLFACYTNYNIRLFCQLLVFCQVTIHMTFSKPPQFFVS